MWYTLCILLDWINSYIHCALAVWAAVKKNTIDWWLKKREFISCIFEDWKSEMRVLAHLYLGPCDLQKAPFSLCPYVVESKQAMLFLPLLIMTLISSGGPQAHA